MKTRWEKLCDLEYYTEGPGLDREGNLYFTTMTGGDIMKCTPGGSPSPWARLKCPNGQRILENGHHLVCDTQAQAIVELDRDGNTAGNIIAKTCANHSFEAPNDLILDSSDGLYFTDSVRHQGQVFYISADGNEKLVAAGLDYPNGIVLSPDHQKLFIAESYTNRILVFELSEPGVVKYRPEVFIDLPSNLYPLEPNRMPFTASLPDGIAFDQKGRLWVAHYGMGALQVVDSQGQLISTVPTGIPATSNMCFSADYRSVYVTGGRGEPGPGSVHKIFLDFDSNTKA